MTGHNAKERIIRRGGHGGGGDSWGKENVASSVLGLRLKTKVTK